MLITPNTDHWFDPNSVPNYVCNAKLGVWLNFLVADYRQVNWRLWYTECGLTRIFESPRSESARLDRDCNLFLFSVYEVQIATLKLSGRLFLLIRGCEVNKLSRLHLLHWGVPEGFWKVLKITRGLLEHWRPVGPYNSEVHAFIRSAYEVNPKRISVTEILLHTFIYLKQLLLVNELVLEGDVSM